MRVACDVVRSPGSRCMVVKLVDVGPVSGAALSQKLTFKLSGKRWKQGYKGAAKYFRKNKAQNWRKEVQNTFASERP